MVVVDGVEERGWRVRTVQYLRVVSCGLVGQDSTSMHNCGGIGDFSPPIRSCSMCHTVLA